MPIGFLAGFAHGTILMIGLAHHFLDIVQVQLGQDDT